MLGAFVERRLAVLLAACAVFSGVALVVHILARVSLQLSLLIATAIVATAVVAIWRRTTSATQRAILGRTIAGAGAGVLATAAYDAAKFVLSRAESSPYDPFAVLRIFGVLLAGEHAPDPVLYATGTAFHVLNGVSFGIAYALLFPRGGILAGVGWGFFLEAFQLALYPGWLDIRAITEFAQLSALAHVAYGATLGAACRFGQRRILPVVLKGGGLT